MTRTPRRLLRLNKKLAAVATALWAVLKRSAEADRPQAGGYNISRTALKIDSFKCEKAVDEVG